MHDQSYLGWVQSPETKVIVEKFGQAQVDLFSSNNYDPIGGYMACDNQLFDFFSSSIQFGSLFGATFAAQCKATLEEPGLIERLRVNMFTKFVHFHILQAAKYDVLLAEHFDMCGVGMIALFVLWDSLHSSFSGLVEVIKPKSFISVSTSVVFGSQFEEYGIPNMPSFDPGLRFTWKYFISDSSSRYVWNECSLHVGSSVEYLQRLAGSLRILPIQKQGLSIVVIASMHTSIHIPYFRLMQSSERSSALVFHRLRIFHLDRPMSSLIRSRSLISQLQP